MGVKGWWQRPGEGYDDGHELIFGKRERVQYVPPPLPALACPKCGVDRLKEPCGAGYWPDCPMMGVAGQSGREQT